MSTKTFDASLNLFADIGPADWANFFAVRAGIPPGPATPLDTDLSVTAQADKLIRIDGPAPAILHLEFESASRRGRARVLHRYNALIHKQTGLPVHSVIVLLRPPGQLGRSGRNVHHSRCGRPAVPDVQLHGPAGLAGVDRNAAGSGAGGSPPRAADR